MADTIVHCAPQFNYFMGHPTNVAQTTIGGDATYTQPGMRPMVFLNFKYDGGSRVGSATPPPGVVRWGTDASDGRCRPAMN